MPQGRPKKHAKAEAARQSQVDTIWRRASFNAEQRWVARWSSHICLPEEPIVQGSNETPDQPEQSRSPSYPLAIEDAELAQQIEHVQISEAEQVADLLEYDASIARAIEESEIHIADAHATTAEIQCDKDTEGVGREYSYASPLPEPTRGRTADQCNTPSKTPTPTSSSLRTPDQQSATPSRSTGRKRTRPFPTQSNTLMTWLSPTPAAPTARSNPPPLPIEQAPTPDPAPILLCPTNPISNATNVAIPMPISLFPSRPKRVATSLPTPIAPPPTATLPTATPPMPTATPHNPSPDPAESTAYKLAKQLRGFQGCTHKQHNEAEGLHQAYHQRVEVHSACSSLPQITSLIRGDYARGTPLPNVLSNPKLMQPADLPAGLDLPGAYEGISVRAFPEDAGTPDEHLPRRLCLSQHHDNSAKDRAPKTTFDVDSLCCFPSSLGFARQGIHWYPRSHAFLNINQDIHFSLPEAAFNQNGEVVTQHVPLHKIPHCCFGTAIGMESLAIFLFFPELRIDSQYEHSNFLSTSDHELWYDAILFPALTKVVGDANQLQHYPVPAHVARLDASALASETFARKETAREQLFKYVLQPHDLDALWTLVQERIADNPGCARFNNAKLFAHSKNTKLEHMDNSLISAYGRWEQCWALVADPHFYSRDRTFVDIGKQVTSEDSALPYDAIPEACEAEVYLWKRCCLEAYANLRIDRLADGKRTKGSARLTTYPWATMRETMGQTLFAMPQGQESMDGLEYSQFYGLSKTPFDTSKAYVFYNEALENLALDPGYVRSLQQQGGGATFSKGVCEVSYLHSKKRAHANLVDNQWRSYGIREEHRVTLTLMDAVREQWTQWDLYDDRIDDTSRPRPYFIIPTKTLLGFLSAQINKYCFLFEYTLAHTARTYSLPETTIMVAALRALRFCYGSNMLAGESLLYKDRWEQPRGQRWS
ncbi:hypothetical protein T440DRAFT_523630 [Plenodomus tracheiphilus IPT5]|uniref:Uncharacterized protein n=1 Tax=Plenodomus tracheiphilus IPT5 TaxID=1408161 RepID=A0A6A7APM2_9PLEO|nr:hypothetical protein T440DRAFT_523630 [Plenodomus tracheiphilus IPT5]